MSFVVVIPARYASTRLPGKPLQDIAGKPMIEHVVGQANQSQASRVIVATDDQRIADALTQADCEVCLTREDHQSGSDRLAEVVEKLSIADDTIVVNIQGDEPMIPPKLINQVAQTLAQTTNAVMSTAAHAIRDEKDILNPNIVKVVFDRNGRAMYFSRAPIPFNRDHSHSCAWRHIGIYAYRSGFLKRYHLLPSSDIEQTECLEQLRVLENGDAIMVRQIDYDAGVGVDTQEDLDSVRALLT